MSQRTPIAVSCSLTLALLWSVNAHAETPPTFTDVSEASNAAWAHDIDLPYESPADLPTPIQMSGGVAAGDLDRDGDIDLYLVTGSAFPNRLLINDGNGRFEDRASAWGVAFPGEETTGPVFLDFDADGHLDLVLGGTMGAGLRLLRNDGAGRFAPMASAGGITRDTSLQHDASIGAGDPDGDGDLDLYIGHWGATGETNHFWINTGAGVYVPGDELAGVQDIYAELDWTFAPSFTDMNGDGRQDLLITSDFGTSHTLRNLDGLTFENVNVGVIDDKSGMGSAPGDYDNDGDVDWFVSSIFYDEPIPDHGNRLYRNDGEGNFSDDTDAAGVRDGAWGWSACAADFNNDGWLDIFHVNGMYFVNEREDFSENASKLFMNRGDGTFVERTLEANIDDPRQGRGVACFDADGDGDVDIFTANVFGESSLFRNDLVMDEATNWLQIRLDGEADNPGAVGAVIRVTTGDLTQHREVTIGSNYQSQNPLVQHFGLGDATSVDRVEIQWPHGSTTVLTDQDPNQQLVLSATAAALAPHEVQAGMAGAWYDPARNGEGFLIEVLGGDVATLYWFTYDREGNQDWYVAVGEIRGRRILFPQVLRVSGGVFGDDFDPGQVTREVVGTAAFTFDECATGTMDWTLAPGMSARDLGRQDLVQIAPLAGLPCQNPDFNGPVIPEEIPVQGPGVFSGSWYDPTHDGEGFVLQVLESGQAVVYWYSFDDSGARRWFFGLGEGGDGQWTFETMNTSLGGLFGKAFDPAQVSFPDWGSLELDLSCTGGTARWSAREDGFSDGTLNLERVTLMRLAACP